MSKHPRDGDPDLVARVRAALEESARVKRDLAREVAPEIAQAAEWIAAANRSGGKTLLFSNGGSAADAQHIACEFTGRLNRDRPALPAIALTANTSELTAIGNDYGFEQVFSRLRILGANTVFFDRAMPGDYADFVGLDEAHAIRTLMGDIKRRGITDLSLVSFEGAKTLPLSRREEYVAVECEKSGIAHKLHRVPYVGRIDGKLRANRRNWFPNGKGKGVFCINDEIAVVVREICGARLPIWGIDGLPIAAEAGITSYRQPIAKMARKAIELLARQQRLGHRWSAQRVLLKGKLVEE